MFMTQAQSNQNKPLGVQAAAAATASAAPAKPSDAKPADAKPPAPTPRKKAADMTPAEKEAAKAERLAKAKKVFIVIGDLNTDNVYEFASVNQAEKFLNAKDAPGIYTVLRGNRIGTSKKVSLR